MHWAENGYLLLKYDRGNHGTMKALGAYFTTKWWRKQRGITITSISTRKNYCDMTPIISDRDLQ